VAKSGKRTKKTRRLHFSRGRNFFTQGVAALFFVSKTSHKTAVFYVIHQNIMELHAICNRLSNVTYGYWYSWRISFGTADYCFSRRTKS